MTPILVFVLIALGQGRRVKQTQENRIDIKMDANETALVEYDTTFKNNPLVVNKASMPIVVYLERGFLFNKQVIRPGEAVQLYSSGWGPNFLPYSIVALVGDESALPSDLDSFLNFVGMAAVPTAFVGGVIVSVVSWGALTGPSAALAPLVSNLPAVAGFTIGAVDIAAGVAAAGGAKQVADMLVKKHPGAFMNKIQHQRTGEKYFEITGGPDGFSNSSHVEDLKISEISWTTYKSYDIKDKDVKLCVGERSTNKMNRAAFEIEECGDGSCAGKWTHAGQHSGRPKYHKVEDDKWIIEWSKSRKVWRMFYDDSWFGKGRETLYQSKVNSGSVPDKGWELVEGGTPVPTIDLMMSSEEDEDDDLDDSE